MQEQPPGGDAGAAAGGLDNSLFEAGNQYHTRVPAIEQIDADLACRGYGVTTCLLSWRGQWGGAAGDQALQQCLGRAAAVTQRP